MLFPPNLVNKTEGSPSSENSLLIALTKSFWLVLDLATSKSLISSAIISLLLGDLTTVS